MEIHVMSMPEQEENQHVYRSPPQAVEKVTAYLRGLRLREQLEEDPNLLIGAQTLVLTIVYSDGTQSEHHQFGMLFGDGEGNWQLMEPEQGAELRKIVHSTPGDYSE